MQEALRATTLISAILRLMDRTILEATDNNSFILGDTPIPQSELARGFRVSLSKSIAVEALPRDGTRSPIVRRTATAAEVNAINREQWENAIEIVIGPNPTILKSFQR
jgi:hypothetical protein